MKIAISISGQPRNFKESYDSLKKNLLSKYDCDLYFHSWIADYFQSTDFGIGNKTYQLSKFEYDEVIKLYKPKEYILEKPIQFDASGYKCPIWRQPLNNTLSMYYSIYKSFQLIKPEYDYVIRTRFDIDYSKLDLSLPTNAINVPEWNTDIRVKNRGYYDIFAIGNYSDMKVYSETFSYIIKYVSGDNDFLKFLHGGWPIQDSPLRNEYLLKWHLIKNNIQVNELSTFEKSASVGIIR
jgi:hypothetical protein